MIRNRDISRGTLALIALVLALPFTGWAVAQIYNGVVFDIHCESYLKRAADSNTVETAREELDKAIKYIEDNRMTEGNTGIILKSPTNDVGFWYKNLTEAKAELDKVGPNVTPLERTNMLMKLRETLLIKGDKGEHVTAPSGISVFPNNLAYCIWCTIGVILLLASLPFWYDATN